MGGEPALPAGCLSLGPTQPTQPTSKAQLDSGKGSFPRPSSWASFWSPCLPPSRALRKPPLWASPCFPPCSGSQGAREQTRLWFLEASGETPKLSCCSMKSGNGTGECPECSLPRACAGSVASPSGSLSAAHDRHSPGPQPPLKELREMKSKARCPRA